MPPELFVKVNNDILWHGILINRRCHKKSSLYMYAYVNGSYLYVYRHNADEAMAKWRKYTSICIIEWLKVQLMQQRGQKKTQKLHLNVMTQCFADIPLFHLSNCTTIFHSLVSILSSNLTRMSVYLHCKNVKHAGRLAHIDTNNPPKGVLLAPKTCFITEVGVG